MNLLIYEFHWIMLFWVPKLGFPAFTEAKMCSESSEIQLLWKNAFHSMICCGLWLRRWSGSTNQKVGVLSFLDKILNPKLTLAVNAGPVGVMCDRESASHRCTVWMYGVDGWVVKLHCKELWVVRARQGLYKYRLFTLQLCAQSVPPFWYWWQDQLFLFVHSLVK